MAREVNDIEGSMLVLWVDGRCCVAPLRKDRLTILVRMLHTFQHEDPDGKLAVLLPLPPNLTFRSNQLAEGLTAVATRKAKDVDLEPTAGPGQIKLERHVFEMRELLGRAVRNVRGKRGNTLPRWALVRELFCCGSTVATHMCREFDLDPDEVLKK